MSEAHSVFQIRTAFSVSDGSILMWMPRLNALKPRRSGAHRRLRLPRPTALTQIAQARPLGSVSEFPREPKNETAERQNRNLPEHQK
jgi:hypothetical protein